MLNRKTILKKWTSLWCVCLLLFSFVGCTQVESPASKASGDLRITYIDVGQGHATLFVAPSGKTMLLDTGLGQAYGALQGVMQREGVDHLDTVVITHPHQDHMGALPAVLAHIPVGELYINGKTDTRLYARVVAMAKEKHLALHSLSAGDSLPWDSQATWEVLAPKAVAHQENVNNYSPIMRLTYGKHHFLFSGDAEREVEQEAVATGRDLSSDIVLVGHHGSITSSLPAYAKKTHSKVAIISVGKDNSYGHPDPIVVKRWKLVGATLYTTIDCGDITAISDGNDLWLEATKGLHPLS